VFAACRCNAGFGEVGVVGRLINGVVGAITNPEYVSDLNTVTQNDVALVSISLGRKQSSGLAEVI
jgi:hypothetical protein